MIRSHAHVRGQSVKPDTYPEKFQRDALRESIQLAVESISNFIKPQPETATKQLDGTFKPQELGNPLIDVEMNQMGDELGSDEQNAPTVAIDAGSTKGGNGPRMVNVRRISRIRLRWLKTWKQKGFTQL